MELPTPVIGCRTSVGHGRFMLPALSSSGTCLGGAALAHTSSPALPGPLTTALVEAISVLDPQRRRACGAWGCPAQWVAPPGGPLCSTLPGWRGCVGRLAEPLAETAGSRWSTRHGPPPWRSLGRRRPGYANVLLSPWYGGRWAAAGRELVHRPMVGAACEPPDRHGSAGPPWQTAAIRGSLEQVLQP